MTETVIANALLFLPSEVNRGSLRMAGGCITEMSPGVKEPKPAITPAPTRSGLPASQAPTPCAAAGSTARVA